MILLKFCRTGEPLERMLSLTADNRYLQWNSNFFAFKKKEETRGLHANDN
jgi:hypothetical protein